MSTGSARKLVRALSNTRAQGQPIPEGLEQAIIKRMQARGILPADVAGMPRSTPTTKSVGLA